MQVYLLNSGIEAADLDQLEARVRHTVSDVQRVASLEAVAEGLRSNPLGQKPFVLYPVGSGDSFERLIELAGRTREFFFLVFVSEDISGAHYKRLVQTGAEWVP